MAKRLTSFRRFLLAATMGMPVPLQMNKPLPKPHVFYGPEGGWFARNRLDSTRRACESTAMAQTACPVSQRPDAKSTSTTHAAIVSNMFVTLLSRPSPAAGKP